MIIGLYDRNFISLADSSSLNVGNYTIRRRAVDFDEITVISEPFVQDVNPTFLIFKNDMGRYYYGCLAGIPQIDKDNKTSIQGSDLKTLFNNDIIVNLGGLSSVQEIFSVVGEALAQIFKNTMNVIFETAIDVALTDYQPENKTICANAWEIIKPYLLYYDVYIDTSIDLRARAIRFRLKKIGTKTVPLRAWEFNLKNLSKWVASVNETQACVYVKNSDGGGQLFYGRKFILREDNSISMDDAMRNLYPVKRKLFFRETENIEEKASLMTAAEMDALSELAKARNNESIELSTQGIEALDEVDFGTNFNVFLRRGQFYKRLPLGETEDRNGVKTLKIGYKADDLVVYL